MIDKNYNKWLKFSKIITNNKSADDLLQDFVLIILEKKIPNEKLTDNYVFVSLKNMFLTRIKKKKIEIEELDQEKENSVLIENYLSVELKEELISDDSIMQNKIDVITETVLSLNQFERKLYQLHFIYGLSQRKIAREIGVSHLTINQRINKIKQKIKDNYDRKQN